MKTSYFANRALGKSGLVRIGIATRPPKWMENVRSFKALASHPSWLRMSKEDYLPRFDALLSQLDPYSTYERLVDMAHGGEPVLLCYEAPPFTEANWCHRRIVADWFEQALDIEVPEFETPPKIDPQLSFF